MREVGLNSKYSMDKWEFIAKERERERERERESERV
jgi:hypothetical protein